MNLITSFAYGCNFKRKSLFDVKSPFFANETLAYPFIPNYYSSTFLSCYHSDIHDSAVYPSIPFIFCIFVALINISFQFSHSQIVCCLAPYLFIFTGGLGFTRFLNEKARESFFIDYVHNWGLGRYEYWFQTIIHILLPQRASLFSMGLAWSIISILIECHSKLSIKEFAMCGLLVAALGQIQPHSIIAVGEWGIAFALITFPTKKLKKLKSYLLNYLILGMVAIIFGLPQFLPFLHRASKNFFKIAPLYIEMPNHNFITLWWYGLGIFIVLALIHVPLTSSKHQLSIYIPSLVVFIISNFVWYQPWSLDNTKVFNAAFIPVAAIGISTFFVRLFKFRFIGTLVFLILLILCTLSGIMGVVSMFPQEYNLWSKNGAYHMADFIITRTDPNSIWLTDSDHTNPVVTLAGRQTFVGYPGWLSSHGLDYSPRNEIIRRLVKNPERTWEIDEHNIKYVAVLSTSTSFNFKPGKNSEKWKLIYSTSFGTIYQRTNVI